MLYQGLGRLTSGGDSPFRMFPKPLHPKVGVRWRPWEVEKKSAFLLGTMVSLEMELPVFGCVADSSSLYPSLRGKGLVGLVPILSTLGGAESTKSKGL